MQKEIKRDKLISIILPVYNAELYVGGAIECLKKQTFSQFEVIIIDDSSDDRSIEIIKSKVKGDERFSLYINEKNEGAGAVRNRGIDIAIGKYIMFLDVDDLFEADLLQEMFWAIETSDADIAICEFDNFIQHKEINIERKFIGEVREIEITSIEGISWVTTNPWSKIYRKELIVKNAIFFQNLKNCNDIYFVIFSFCMARKIVHVRTIEPLIHYRTESSQYQISADRDPFCCYEAYIYLKERILEQNKLDEYGGIILHLFRASAWYNLTYCKNLDVQERFYNFLKSNEAYQFAVSLIDTRSQQKYFDKNILVFNAIKKLEYHTKWFVNIGIITLLLYENKERTEKLLYKCQCKGEKVFVWGAGNNGKEIVRFCNQQGRLITSFVDSSIEKQGDFCEGIEIISADKLLEDEKKGMILASNEKIYYTIVTQRRDLLKSFTILNFYSFLFGKEYEQCIK